MSTPSQSDSASTLATASEPDLATSGIPADPALVADAKRGARALLGFLLVAVLASAGLLVFGLTRFPAELHALVIVNVAVFIAMSTLVIGSMGAEQYSSARHAERTGVACEVDWYGVTLTGKSIPWAKIIGFRIEDSRTEAGGPGEVRLWVYTGRRDWVSRYLNMYATPDRVDDILDHIRVQATARGLMVEEGSTRR